MPSSACAFSRFRSNESTLPILNQRTPSDTFPGASLTRTHFLLTTSRRSTTPRVR
jgi:hypothetical protein